MDAMSGSTVKRHLAQLIVLMFATMLLQVTVIAVSVENVTNIPDLESKIEDVFKDFPNNCVCVPFYLCINDTINIYGNGILDIRSSINPCADYIEKCCTKVNESTKIPPIKDQTCGYWNAGGVGFKILGDTNNEAQLGEFPWMMSILNIDTQDQNETNFCGGSLIHPQVVLTAAHCVHNKDKKNLMIRAGEWDSGTKNEIYKHQDRKVLKIIKHEHFDIETSYNNVALIIVVEPFSIEKHVSTICLPSQDLEFSEERCYSSGWGRNSFFNKSGEPQNILKKIDLPIVSRNPCLQLLRTTKLGDRFELHNSFICAGGEDGKDTCKGDGGGPLMCPLYGKSTKYVQAGIVAWGIGCGTHIPGVYTNVAMFRNWIDKQMKNENFDTKSYDLEYIPDSATGLSNIQKSLQDKIDEIFADKLHP